MASIPDKLSYRFLFSPKSTDNPFFDIAKEGCMDQARFMENVECVYVGPVHFQPDGVEQAHLIQQALEEAKAQGNPIHGVAISVTNAEAIDPVISAAVDEYKVPVVTWDSDAPNSKRHSYIGTDQYFFGSRLAQVLKQLEPEGGTFALISEPTPNIAERERGVREHLLASTGGAPPVWTEIAESPTDIKGNNTLALEQMRQLAFQYRTNLTAIVPVMGGPMFLYDDWKAFVDAFPELRLVVADALPSQLALLSRNYAHGLVEQLPYEMGELSMKALLELVEGRPFPEFQGTNVLEHINVPLVLPPLTIDPNHLGKLAYVGYVLFGLIAACSSMAISWTYSKRNVRVVKVAQPFFLIMVALGILVMGSTMVPMSLDDAPAHHTEARGIWICMSSLWLFTFGFTITFSAFFAKTWRINKLFQSHKRSQVKAKDVMLPFVILMAINLLILTLWTILDPLHYTRQNHQGTDAWNRVMSTYGSCECHNPLPYILPLGLVNFGMLAFANWEAYKARNIESEFSESRYIAFCMISMLQAGVIGVPLLFLVRELPQAYYLVLVLLIFIICQVLLVVIFVPKYRLAKKHQMRSVQSQLDCIRHSMEVSSKRTAEADRLSGSMMSSIGFTGSSIGKRLSILPGEGADVRGTAFEAVQKWSSIRDRLKESLGDVASDDDEAPKTSNRRLTSSPRAASRRRHGAPPPAPSSGSRRRLVTSSKKLALPPPRLPPPPPSITMTSDFSSGVDSEVEEVTVPPPGVPEEEDHIPRQRTSETSTASSTEILSSSDHLINAVVEEETEDTEEEDAHSASTKKR